MERNIKIITLMLLAATALATTSVRAQDAETEAETEEAPASAPVKLHNDARFSAEVDATLPVDGRIRELEYNKNDIYTLLTRVGYQSHIQFGVREEVDTISVGDRSFWQIIPAGNRLFIRPMADDVATNMTVITNKHSYQFDLQSTSDSEKKIIYVARFVYPNEIKDKPIPTYDPFLIPPAPPPMPAPTAPVTSQLLPPPPAMAPADPVPSSLAAPYPAPYVAPRPVVEPLPMQSEFVPPPMAVSTRSAEPLPAQAEYVAPPPAEPAYVPAMPSTQAYVEPAPAPVETHPPQPVELKPMTDEELAQLPSPLLEPPPPPSQPPLEAVPSYAPIAPAPVAQGNTRNLQYTFAGPSEAAPYEVFDNGVTTHLLYQNPPATLPLISVMDENNRETPVTVYQKDGYIAVDTVAARLVVRTEGATVYVFNEALSVKR